MEQNNTKKCRYYNQGYCKKKNNCKYIHIDIDCEEDCSLSTCTKRHRIQCKDGNECYYFSKDNCEFLHNNMIKKIKENIKDENRNFRTKINELAMIIETKDNQLRQKDMENQEIQYKFSQIMEQNKIASERIERLEKRVNENVQKEEEGKNDIVMKTSKKMETNIEDVEMSDSKEEINHMKEIDTKFSILSKDEIKYIKEVIKNNGPSYHRNPITVSSKQFNQNKINVYTCKECEVTIMNDREVIVHMTEKHKLRCQKCPLNFIMVAQLITHENDVHPYRGKK